jgi:hypothetical protein
LAKSAIFPVLLLAVDVVGKVALLSAVVVDPPVDDEPLLSVVVVVDPPPVDDEPLLSVVGELPVDDEPLLSVVGELPVDDEPLLSVDWPLAYIIAEAGKNIETTIKNINEIVIPFIVISAVTYL